MPLKRSTPVRDNDVSDSSNEDMQNALQNAQQMRVLSALICETPVTLLEKSTLQGAPKKSVVYLCRLQEPPCVSLRGEWCLEPYGVRGYWGYVFKYETSELWLYRRNEGVTVGPLSAVGMLSSNDWAVLRLVILNRSALLTLSEDPQDQEGGVTAKQPRLEAEAKATFNVVWQSRSCPSGRWFLRASLQTSGERGATERFVLECFNSDCGVFQTLLDLPGAAWKEKMKEIGEEITTLFTNCRKWNDVLTRRLTTMWFPPIPEDSPGPAVVSASPASTTPPKQRERPASVIHLLNITLHKFRREQCFGCRINHPSQRQHPCVEHVEDDYYRINFQGIMKMLLTPHFIPSIQRLLTARNIPEDDVRVKAVAHTLLHELRSAKNIQDSIGGVYDELIGEDVLKIGQLKLVTEGWECE
ncbi:hypothetical protein PAMA_005590 [Pampus argenteus]